VKVCDIDVDVKISETDVTIGASDGLKVVIARGLLDGEARAW
jgi:hypothetical protein